MDEPQLETISFETITKVVKNCTIPKGYIQNDKGQWIKEENEKKESN